MSFKIYDYVSPKGRNEFEAWAKKLQVKQRAALNEKIKKLELYDQEFYSNLLADSGKPGILKLRIMAGGVQLRPLLCRGPINVGKEYTFLIGAKEISWKYAPADALDTADNRKQEVFSDPVNRRTKHARVV
jgi:hypothetical protein